MFLKFIGSGSAFNPKLGNTSSFFKNGSTMYLIDCGSTVFSKIIEKNLLDGVENLNVFVTHLHPDHVGSLGDLIFYTYFVKDIKLNLYYPDPERIGHLLILMGVTNEYYNLEYCLDIRNIGYFKDNYAQIHSIANEHVKELSSYGYIIKLKNEEVTIFYSGDCKNLRNLSDFIKWNMLESSSSKKYELYQDATSLNYKENVHAYYGDLLSSVRHDLRKFIYIMHIDSKFDKNQALKDGFNVVENI